MRILIRASVLVDSGGFEGLCPSWPVANSSRDIFEPKKYGLVSIGLWAAPCSRSTLGFRQHEVYRI